MAEAVRARHATAVLPRERRQRGIHTERLQPTGAPQLIHALDDRGLHRRDRLGEGGGRDEEQKERDRCCVAQSGHQQRVWGRASRGDVVRWLGQRV
jgi:hypothetical protein